MASKNNSSAPHLTSPHLTWTFTLTSMHLHTRIYWDYCECTVWMRECEKAWGVKQRLTTTQAAIVCCKQKKDYHIACAWRRFCCKSSRGEQHAQGFTWQHIRYVCKRNTMFVKMRRPPWITESAHVSAIFSFQKDVHCFIRYFFTTVCFLGLESSVINIAKATEVFYSSYTTAIWQWLQRLTC